MKIRLFTSLMTSGSLLFIPLTNAETDATWKVSQSDFGGIGLMQTPTARMENAGELNLGVSVNDDYQHFGASFQLMSWLETTVRYTLIPDVLYNEDESYSGDTVYTDKSIDFKVRLLEESYWLPETSIGFRDLGGSSMFDGEFIAMTKRFGSVDFTLGLGWGYLGQSDSISNPFCQINDRFCSRPDEFKGNGGSFDYERWFTGPTSLFGGIEYQTPHEPLRIKIEYDGNDYSDDFPTKQSGRNPNPKSMTQHTPWNFGINYRLGHWGDAKVSYQRGDTLSLGMNIYTNINEIKTPWRDDAQPEIELRPAEDYTAMSEQLEKNAGYEKTTISREGNTLWISGEQNKYRDNHNAIARAATIISNNSSPEISEFKVIEQNNGMNLKQTTVNREKFVWAANYMEPEAEISDSYFDSEAEKPPVSSVIKNPKRWDYAVDPILEQSIGAPEAFNLYSFGLNLSSNYWLTDNLELSGSVYVTLSDNYDKFNYVANSPHINNYSVPRVRTMFRAYVHDNPLTLNTLQLTWFEQPAENIYTQAYAGYLEMMFAGVGGEVLYRPLASNWAVGLDVNLVSQRDPDSLFETFSEDYFFYDEANCDYKLPYCQAYVLSKGTTGHLTGYYMPKWDLLENTLFKLSAGKFLGGDIGVQFDVSKRFDSGITIGAYAAKTNLTAEEYGEGSFNKGFYVSIPLDVITVKPSTSRASMTWEPITRDGGQMLNRKYYLFEETDGRSPWYQRH